METGSTDPFFIIGQGVFLVKVLVVSYSKMRDALLITEVFYKKRRKKERSYLIL